jgi:uncharacterized protein YkwD/outer membrane murein-binding lipoprotein Lpp
LATATWQYRFIIQKFFQKFPQISQIPTVSQIAQDISAPPPLVGQTNDPNSSLTREGVINWTNTNRQQNGALPPLKENLLLDKAAQAKLQDMFKQQYFEHVNPQGVGPGDLAKQAGYDYISEGENLALGNFTNDQDLVTAWMNSPGHRANILNKGFEEIGVAVGQGIYQGHQTWLAVQEFGKPASSCPSIDSNLKAEITGLNSDINQMKPQLTQLKTEIDSANPQSQSQYDAYNQEVAQYNSMVQIYNNKVDVLKLDTDQYNNEVSAYNACLGS